MHHMCAGTQGGGKRASSPLELRLQTVVSHRGCWELISGPLQEQPALLPAELSLQSSTLSVFMLLS